MEQNPLHSDLDFRSYVVEHLSGLRTQMQMLVGNGQPGRIGHLESKVRQHDRWLWVATGGALAIGYIVRELLLQIR